MGNVLKGKRLAIKAIEAVNILNPIKLLKDTVVERVR